MLTNLKRISCFSTELVFYSLQLQFQYPKLDWCDVTVSRQPYRQRSSDVFVGNGQMLSSLIDKNSIFDSKNNNNSKSEPNFNKPYVKLKPKAEYTENKKKKPVN